MDGAITLVAHHSYRAPDHKGRLVDIIQELFCAEGINLEKPGLEVTIENFKYAFGAVLNLQKREVKVPVAKLKKTFLSKSSPTLSCGTETPRWVQFHDLLLPSFCRVAPSR